VEYLLTRPHKVSNKVNNMYPFQSEILGFKEVVIHTYESADII